MLTDQKNKTKIHNIVKEIDNTLVFKTHDKENTFDSTHEWLVALNQHIEYANYAYCS